MAKKKEKLIELSREDAFDARPLGAKVQSRIDLPDGGARITIGCKATRTQRFLLRLPNVIERQFVLDAFGVEVLELCDGQKNVRHIVKRFAKTHNLNHQEAQHAITTFLKDMMKKGLVVMVMPK